MVLAALLTIMCFALILRLTDNTCTGADGKTWEHVEYAERILAGNFKIERADIDHGKGYAALLSLVFLLFGRDLQHIEAINIIFSLLTLPAVFLVTKLITKNSYAGLVAALLLALLPVAIEASLYGSEHNIALFLSSSAFLVFIIYLESKSFRFFILAAAFLSLATHFRLECTIFAPIFLFYPLIYEKGKTKSGLKIRFLVLAVLFSQFIAYYVILPIRLSYIKDNNDPLLLWVNGSRGNMEETFDHKYPWIKHPGLFSTEVFPINVNANISALANKSAFAILLMPFLFVAIIGIKSWRNLLLIFLWILVFFFFFSFWWATSITNPALYQVLILSPIAIGIASGWLFFYNYLSGLSLGEKTKKAILNSFFVFLILGSFLPSYSKHYAKEELCLKADLQDVLKGVSADSCLVASNVGYGRVSASIVTKYSTNREILTDPKNCNTEKIYYLKYVPFESIGQDFEKNCFVDGCDAEVIIVKKNWVLCKLFFDT